MPSLKDELLKLKNKVDGINGVLVVGRDGFVLDFVGDFEAEEVGAICSTAIGAVETMGNDLGQGVLDALMAEFETGKVIVSLVDEEAILVTVTDAKANLGGIRYNIRKIKASLKEAL